MNKIFGVEFFTLSRKTPCCIGTFAPNFPPYEMLCFCRFCGGFHPNQDAFPRFLLYFFTLEVDSFLWEIVEVLTTVGILSKLPNSFPTRVLKQMYVGIAHPRLQYAFTSWGKTPVTYNNIKNVKSRLVFSTPNENS